jgi:hypothetical protein
MAFLGLYKGLLANRGGGEIAATSMYPLVYPDEQLFMVLSQILAHQDLQ